MKKAEVKKNEQGLVKGSERALLKIADFFGGVMCTGLLYEIKVPKKLQK